MIIQPLFNSNQTYSYGVVRCGSIKICQHSTTEKVLRAAITREVADRVIAALNYKAVDGRISILRLFNSANSQLDRLRVSLSSRGMSLCIKMLLNFLTDRHLQQRASLVTLSAGSTSQ